MIQRGKHCWIFMCMGSEGDEYTLANDNAINYLLIFLRVLFTYTIIWRVSSDWELANENLRWLMNFFALPISFISFQSWMMRLISKENQLIWPKKERKKLYRDILFQLCYLVYAYRTTFSDRFYFLPSDLIHADFLPLEFTVLLKLAWPLLIDMIK